MGLKSRKIVMATALLNLIHAEKQVLFPMLYQLGWLA